MGRPEDAEYQTRPSKEAEIAHINQAVLSLKRALRRAAEEKPKANPDSADSRITRYIPHTLPEGGERLEVQLGERISGQSVSIVFAPTDDGRGKLGVNRDFRTPSLGRIALSSRPLNRGEIISLTQFLTDKTRNTGILGGLASPTDSERARIAEVTEARKRSDSVRV